MKCEEDGSARIVAELPAVDASLEPLSISVVMTSDAIPEYAVREAIASIQRAISDTPSKVMDWEDAKRFWDEVSRGSPSDGLSVSSRAVFLDGFDQAGAAGRILRLGKEE